MTLHKLPGTDWRLEDFTTMFKGWRPQPMDCYRFYAVLVPLVEQNGELHVLYEVRAEGLKHQPGQVCFPGGHIEIGESAGECAIRETCEELNMEPGEIELIGPLDYLHTYSNFTMYPFLGVIRRDGGRPIIPNPDEVKECFQVPVRYLMETEPQVYRYEVLPKVDKDFPYEIIDRDASYRWRKGVTQIPIYRYGQYPIWGLTAQITRRLVEIMQTGQAGSNVPLCREEAHP